MLDKLKRILRFIIKGVPTEKIVATIHVNHTGKLLRGKHVLVTGGASGIGYAIAKKSIEEGAIVLICGRNIEKLQNARISLGGESVCKIEQYDLSDISGMIPFLEKCRNSLGGKIDCLVNNAGISIHERDFHSVTPEGFDKQFNTNYKGSYFLTKYFIEQQTQHNELKGSNILFISSERGSFHTDIPYGLTKAVINSLVGGLNNRLAKFDVRINALAPGVTVSDMTGRNTDDLTYKSSPCGRVFLPEEMAEVATFLLSDYSKCISGEVINCDYGAHLKCI